MNSPSEGIPTWGDGKVALPGVQRCRSVDAASASVLGIYIIDMSNCHPLSSIGDQDPPPSPTQEGP